MNAVVAAVTAGSPRVLSVKRAGTAINQQATGAVPSSGLTDALPFGPFDPGEHRTLEVGMRRWVQEQTRLSLGYVEQLYTFGDRYRDSAEKAGGPRNVSVGYLALVRATEGADAGGATWRDWYGFFPWEDWRAGRPPVIDKVITPRLLDWARARARASERRLREERVTLAFRPGEASWDGERVLERYELIYEAGLVAEAIRDRGPAPANSRRPGRGTRGREPASEHALGISMTLDHRRILATAMGRLRGKIRYRPVVFELLPHSFTLLELQRVVEALAGVPLHKQNFRRLIEKGRLVERTGDREVRTGGRPAARFRFRTEVVLERPAPGVGLPELRSAT